MKKMAGKPLICGIISEFNPFHTGHQALIEAARLHGATHIVAVMSGNFVQRGEPAAFSKWARAEMALNCGVDLVVDLPLPWALSGAENFAFGGVSLLESLGCVDWIAFGSECGDAARLADAAQCLLSPSIQDSLRTRLQTGCTFAKARQEAVRELFGDPMAELLASPNNILGIEYCKALQTLGSAILPFTIRRGGAAHDSGGLLEDGQTPSSSQIRAVLRNGGLPGPQMPEKARDIALREIKAGSAPSDPALLERAILSQLRRMDETMFSRLPDLSEGLDHRLYEASRSAGSLETLFDSVKTKRYPHARIRRLVYSAYLGICRDELPDKPPYLHVLGFTARGREILKCAKISTKVPIITNFSDSLSLDNPSRHVIELESMASDLFSLSLPCIRPCGLEWTSKILTV